MNGEFQKFSEVTEDREVFHVVDVVAMHVEELQFWELWETLKHISLHKHNTRTFEKLMPFLWKSQKFQFLEE